MALPIALQLFSIRDHMEKDPDATLKEVARMGYAGVETCGLYDMAPADFKALCDKHGLTVCSCHQYSDAYLDELRTSVFEDTKTLGAKYSVLAGCWGDYALGGKDHAKFLEGFNKSGKLYADAGMGILYHNHEGELSRRGDHYYIDEMFAEFTDDIAYEPDTAWMKVAGVDPVEFIRTHRCPVIHLKDFAYTKGTTFDNPEDIHRPEGTELRPIGYGSQDIPAILRAAEESGSEWIVVEQDVQTLGMSQLECAECSRNWLKVIGW